MDDSELRQKKKRDSSAVVEIFKTTETRSVATVIPQTRSRDGRYLLVVGEGRRQIELLLIEIYVQNVWSKKERQTQVR